MQEGIQVDYVLGVGPCSSFFFYELVRKTLKNLEWLKCVGKGDLNR